MIKLSDSVLLTMMYKLSDKIIGLEHNRERIDFCKLFWYFIMSSFISVVIILFGVFILASLLNSIFLYFALFDAYIFSMKNIMPFYNIFEQYMKQYMKYLQSDSSNATFLKATFVLGVFWAVLVIPLFIALKVIRKIYKYLKNVYSRTGIKVENNSKILKLLKKRIIDKTCVIIEVDKK